MPAKNGPVRARRFPMRMRLRYRAAGERHWHRGITDNVSCSGVLLRGRHLLPPSATVEMLVDVPRQIAGEARVVVLCRGHVVRVVERKLPLLPKALGVSVADYELLDGREAMAREARLWRATSGMAELTHGLNDMLAVIIGSSELILSEPEATPRIKQNAANIRGAGQRAAAIVQQLLAWTKS